MASDVLLAFLNYYNRYYFMKLFLFFILSFFSITAKGIPNAHPGKSQGVEQLKYIINNDTLALKNIKNFILLPHHKIAVVSEDSLLILQDRKVLSAYSLPTINALLLCDDTLFLGTNSGLYCLTISKLNLQKRSLPARESHPKINSLAIDLEKKIWVGTEAFGAFSMSGETAKPYSVSPYVSTIAVTRDSSVWIGSNVGVFRIFSDGEIKRYYEEIPANGIAIPDNMIEHMNVDNTGHLWIFMSQAVSVLTPDDYEKYHTVIGDGDVDPHTFAFLGSPDNHIQKFIQPKTNPNIWWAISTEGLFQVSDVEFQTEAPPPGIPDKIEQPKAHLRKVTGFQDNIAKKFIAIIDPTNLEFDNEGNLWISGKQGLFKIPKNILREFEPQKKMQAKK